MSDGPVMLQGLNLALSRKLVCITCASALNVNTDLQAQFSVSFLL